MKDRSLAALVLGCTLCVSLGSPTLLAEDIELFRLDPLQSGSLPSILVIIDNQSNWSANSEWPGEATKQERIQEAFRRVFLEMDVLVDRINVGILNVGSSHRQGKVIEGIRRFDAARQASSSFRNRILNMNDAWWSSSNTDYGLLMNEAYKYLMGGRPASQGDQSVRDMSVISNGGLYVPPSEGNCGGTHIIFIGTGFPNNDYPLNNRRNSRDGSEWAPHHLTGYGGNGTVIPLNPNNYQESMADEFARFMSTSPAGGLIRTHVIDIFNPARSQLAQRVFWRSIAQNGKGNYFAVETVDELVDALTMTFDRIMAVNSVFSATSLPVSVNVRGTHLNQIYMGVFRPDDDFNPRWLGNLKLYKLAQDSNTNMVYFADRTSAPAQSGNFVSEDAISFWTTPGAELGGFWAYDPARYPNPYDLPDGDVVEKGGAAQQVREQVAAALPLLPLRNLKTCSAGCAGLTEFNTLSTGLSPNLVNWVTGLDNQLPSERPIATVRPSIHGDVLHSRPAVLNYSADPEDVYVFYGANDGVFRAIRGGLANADGGQELWGFVAPEFFDRLDNLATNTPIDSSTGKTYFMDGGIGLYYELDEDQVSKAWIFPSMRRGGRSIYAFDVTNPAAPSLMWRIEGGTGDFAELGQTWSEPKPVRTPANDGKPVLVFGAGYDPVEDEVEPGARTMGRGIFVVDAESGDLVWSAGGPGSGAMHIVDEMVYSVPSDITVVRRSDFNWMSRVADRAYFGDTGGNVWRVDMGASDVTEWTIERVAALGEDHKFLYPPDVVYGAHPTRQYDAVLIGSGDREKPHDAQSQNAYFMIQDYSWYNDPMGEAEAVITLDDLHDVTFFAADAESAGVPADKHGWMLRFEPGEKAVGGSVTLAGTVYFSTHQPGIASTSLLSCDMDLGVARNYAIRFVNATANAGIRYVVIPGGGFVPSPVAVLVPVEDPNNPDQVRLVEGVLRGTAFDESEGEQLLRRRRTFWFTEHDG